MISSKVIWGFIVTLEAIVSRVVRYYVIGVSAHRCMPLSRPMAIFTLYIRKVLKVLWHSIEVSGHKCGRKFPANHCLNVIKPVIIDRVPQVVTHRVTVYAAFVVMGRFLSVNAFFEERCVTSSEPWLIFRRHRSAVG